MTDVSVLGAGAFGTALALHCSDLGHHTRVWAYDEGLPEEVAAKGENATYLPGVPVPEEVLFTNDMATALQDANLVLLVVPSGFMRSVTTQAAPHLPRGASAHCRTSMTRAAAAHTARAVWVGGGRGQWHAQRCGVTGTPSHHNTPGRCSAHCITPPQLSPCLGARDGVCGRR